MTATDSVELKSNFRDDFYKFFRVNNGDVRHNSPEH